MMDTDGDKMPAWGICNGRGEWLLLRHSGEKAGEWTRFFGHHTLTDDYDDIPDAIGWPTVGDGWAIIKFEVVRCVAKG